jgi:hypothetical protein
MYFNDDRLEEAEKAYLSAKDFDADVVDASVHARISNNLGTIYRDRGQLDRALAEFADTMTWNSTAGSLHMRFSITWNVGMVFAPQTAARGGGREVRGGSAGEPGVGPPVRRGALAERALLRAPGARGFRCGR